MILTELVKPLKTILFEAGEIILEIYNSPENTVIQKKDNSPLTLADTNANNYICAELQKLTPNVPIISEENKEIPYEERKNYTYFWLIDPLDGTKEFIKRNGEFTVNIALINSNTPILGFVYVPVSQKLYWGIKNKGAFSSSLENPKKVKKLLASSFSLNEKHLRVVCSKSHINKATKDKIEKLNQPELHPLGSSLKFMKISEGKADYYIRMGPTMEWDTAASQIIVEEAGGLLLDYNSQKPLAYNKESLLNPYFIATAKLEDSITTLFD